MHAAAENLTPGHARARRQVARRSSGAASPSTRPPAASCSASASTPARPASRPTTCWCRRNRVEAFVEARAASRGRALPDARGEPRLHGDRQRAPSRAPARRLVEDARGARAPARSSSIPPARTSRRAGKLAPTLLTGVDDAMTRDARGDLRARPARRAATATLDDAIAYVNARPRPLALYLFEHDRAAVDRVLAQTVSGGVCVNETIAAHRPGRPAVRRRGRPGHGRTTTAARDSTRSPSARPSSASRASTA